jgi:hypothetical protein
MNCWLVVALPMRATGMWPPMIDAQVLSKPGLYIKSPLDSTA